MKKMKKEDVVASALVEINSHKPLSNGLMWFDKGSGLNTNFNNKIKQTMDVYFPLVPNHKFDIFGNYQKISYSPGAKFQVVVGQTKRAESNTVVIKDLINGKEGFVHWNEFIACCILSPISDLSLSDEIKTRKLKI